MELSRRNFLKAGAAAGAVGIGAMGLAGCSSSSSSDEATEEESTTEDWLGEAPALTVDDCVETIESEVVVVGAALAGSMSAYGAIRNGAQVTVLERNSTSHVGGQEISFLNSQGQLDNGMPEYDPIWVANTLFNQMQMRADMGLIALWCERSGEVFDDMKENMLDPYGQFYQYNLIEDLFPDPDVELTQYVSTGISFSEDTDILQDFMNTIHEWLEDNGANMQYSTRAEVLVQDDDGAVTGVIATNPDGDYVYYQASKGVIMCTGSFGANEAMMRNFYPSKFADFAMNFNTYNAYMSENVDETMDDGLGHKMLCWAGAEIEEICSYQSWYSKGYMGFPYLQVNLNGERFCNEAVSLLTSAHIVIDQPKATNYCWQIVPTNDFDMPTTFGFSREYIETAMDALNGEHYEADTLEELAELIDVDPDTFVATVERYNEFCEAGEDLDYLKAPRYLDPIDDPPYVAWKIPYNFYATTAGVRCNNKLQVLDADNEVIPGLYAAGNTVGYRFGSVYQTLIHGGTNAFACTHGYVAGETAALS